MDTVSSSRLVSLGSNHRASAGMRCSTWLRYSAFVSAATKYKGTKETASQRVGAAAFRLHRRIKMTMVEKMHIEIAKSTVHKVCALLRPCVSAQRVMRSHAKLNESKVNSHRK